MCSLLSVVRTYYAARQLSVVRRHIQLEVKHILYFVYSCSGFGFINS